MQKMELFNVFVIILILYQGVLQGSSLSQPPDDSTGMMHSFDVCDSYNSCDVGNTSRVKFNCQCDELCDIFGDCCKDANTNSKWQVKRKTEIQSWGINDHINCVQIDDNPTHTFYAIDKCPTGYSDDDIRQLCEDKQDEFNDVLLEVAVSHKRTGVAFRNIYCALCHGFTRDDMKFWHIDITCAPHDQEAAGRQIPKTPLRNRLKTKKGKTKSQRRPPLRKKPHWPVESTGDAVRYVRSTDDVIFKNLSNTDLMSQSNCTYELSPPYISFMVRARKCVKTIDVCPTEWNNENINTKCLTQPVGYVWSNSSGYRNKYCAFCNDVDQLYCQKPYVEKSGAIPSQFVSFSILLDFNSGYVSRDEHEHETCDKDHMFDPIQHKCRPLVCQTGYKLVQGKCLTASEDSPQNMIKDDMNIPQNCPLITIENEEYAVLSNGSIFINKTSHVFEKDEYTFQNNSLLVCAENLTSHEALNVRSMDVTQSTLSFIGQIISIIALLVLLAIYIPNKSLHTLPGKCLMCLAFTLFLAQLIFVTGNFVRNDFTACQVVAILTHYFFLASIFWMNVMAFDVWRTFHKQFQAGSSGSKKKFTFYCLYSFLSPGLIVMIACVINYAGISSVPRPEYGEGYCWINHKRAVLYYFALPLFTLLITNIIFFSLAIYSIYKAQTGTAVLQKGKSPSSVKRKRLILYIKLSTIMGLTWIFGFLASTTDTKVLWYFFVLFNTLQGLFICIAFTCNRKVYRLARNSFQRRQKTEGMADTTPATATTVVNRSSRV